MVKKKFKTMIAIGLTFAMIFGSCVTTWAVSADAADVGTEVGNFSFVIENGEAKEELCAEHIVIEKYDDLLEYNSATKKIDAENWRYAPDSYDQEERLFVSNCVIMRTNPEASFAIDAGCIVAVMQYTKNNSFYIQYDSEEAAAEAVKSLKEVDGVRYAEQNSWYFNGEEPTQEPERFPFNDVSEGDWFYSAVKALYDGKIMTGPGTVVIDPTGKFGPYERLARAQFALILYRIEEKPKFETEKKFSDIAGDEWYGEAVLWAAENGIVTGYENGFYGPADNITREQLAAMLYRYAKYKNYDVSGTADYSTFKDADDMQAFSKDSMNWAVANGIIKGKDLDGDLVAETLQPQGSASRAECAVMLQRFLEKYAEE
ncbi:MAG: S-layer homology domain-containing protein [Lachnoclostridium sp.]